MKNYYRDRGFLRYLVRERVGFQTSRKASDNRIGRKADGSLMNIKQKEFLVEDMEFLVCQSDNLRQQEKEIEKYLSKVLERFGVYNLWLKDVVGISAIGAGWVIGEFDIYIADTRAKMFQYAGFNAGLIRGKKSVLAKNYKPEMGEIEKELSKTKDGEKRLKVITNELVRGDKATPGFLLSYNKNLRTALIGIIGSSFIKLNGESDKLGRKRTLSPYRKIYDDYKNRLQNSEKMTKETKKGGKVIDIMWKDATKKHIEDASRRKMMKEFISDLYEQWRAIEGLSVRVRYEEEYLNRKHVA